MILLWCLLVVVEAGANKLNLLMLISDQHRSDALSEAGSTIIHTPNLDKLARDGVRFTNAYTICPVCVPSRTSMLSGKTPEQNDVMGNKNMNLGPRQMTYDRVLLANGYGGEWTGKYHSPYNYTRDDKGHSYYSRDVQWLNGGSVPSHPPAGVVCFTDSCRNYLDKVEPLQLLKAGQLLDGMYLRAYWADVADGRYDQTFNETLRKLSNDFIRQGHANKVPYTSQQDANGRLALKTNHSFSAITFMDAMAALDRLKDDPFTLTVSVEAPHPPFILPPPFYGMYPNDTIPTPTSISDPLTASPYHDPHNPSGDENQVRQMSSNYYGMISENDRLVGILLDKLETLKLSSNTLVIYLADHGELLGDHGMQSKMVFYEGAVHIPMIMRLPGLIPAGRTVVAPVSNLAMFATITDYLSLSGHAPATSQTLRPLIEGSDPGTNRVIFSFWDSDISPGYMAFDGRWKLMIGREAKANVSHVVDEQGFDARGIDALYDLKYDPKEVTNLLRSPYVKKNISDLHHEITPGSKDDLVPYDKAISLKNALQKWLKDTKSKYASPIEKRIMNIKHINQVPVLEKPMPDIAWQIEQPNTLPMPSRTFIDIDGDTLHYSGLLDRAAFPTWLTIDRASGTLHGTPPTKNRHLVRLIATDAVSGAAFVEFQMTVA